MALKDKRWKKSFDINLTHPVISNLLENSVNYKNKILEMPLVY